MSNPPCDEKLAALNVKGEAQPQLSASVGRSCLLQLLGRALSGEVAGAGPLPGTDWSLDHQSAHGALSPTPPVRLVPEDQRSCLLAPAPQCEDQRVHSAGAPQMHMATGSRAPGPSPLCAPAHSSPRQVPPRVIAGRRRVSPAARGLTAASLASLEAVLRPINVCHLSV